MLGLMWRLAILFVDPLGLWRYMLVQPALAAANVLGLVRQPAEDSAAKTDSTAVSSSPKSPATSSSSLASRRAQAERTARELVYRATFVAVAAAVLLWAAVFMYLTFYYTYMPAVEHVHPVRMQYDACNHDSPNAIPTTITSNSNNPDREFSKSTIITTRYDHCEFPHAFVRLDAAGQQRLRLGQQYRVTLHIDMPDSPSNRALGMFMVCASMRDDGARLLDHACRAALMPYRSELVRQLRTWLWSPLYLLHGGAAEQQRVEVELFEAYGLDQRGAVRDVFVELQARNIQFYNVTLHVVAAFSGLRYAMWQWPLLSAAVGIATNLAFILAALALSYYNWAHVLWFERSVRQRLWLPGMGKRRRQLEEGAEKRGKAALEDGELDRSSIEADTTSETASSRVGAIEEASSSTDEDMGRDALTVLADRSGAVRQRRNVSAVSAS